jgi:hypothetical protein
MEIYSLINDMNMVLAPCNKGNQGENSFHYKL